MTVTDAIDKKLNSTYARTAGRMLAQVSVISNSPGSQMQRSLAKLDKEAAQLAEDGEKMLPDNAQLEQTLNEYQRTFETTASLILANDDAIQDTGTAIAVPAVTARVFAGLSSELDAPLTASAMKIYADQARAAGIVWNVPDALDFATDFTNSEEWIKRMEDWAAGYADMMRETLLKGLEQGWGPKYTASQIRQYAQTLPKSAAENITRTLQLTSYRDASAAMEEMNGQFIEGKIRIADLGDGTCLACIALHGTPVPPGESISDHYRGRCDVFYQVAGGDKFPDLMQADSEVGNRQFEPYQSGEDWFNSLSPERQAQQASFLKNPAKLRAFLDGVPLSDFVKNGVDDVFGNMVFENSLVGAIGDDALDYYTKRAGLPSVKPSSELPESVFSGSLSDFERSVSEQDFESAGLYRDGKFIFSKDGTKSAVGFTNDELKEMAGGVLTHNHPADSNFSHSDIEMLFTGGLGEIRAIAGSSTFSMSNPHGVSLTSSQIKNGLTDAFSELAKSGSQNVTVTNAWSLFAKNNNLVYKVIQ